MRTLKKTLSLLLAVALVLSLTVVGASAAYTGNKVDTLKDADEVGEAYSEAVGVMVGLGIIEGYEDATLRPTTTYTREQAAKIIAYMQLGPAKAESLRCTTAPFSDVAADRWSAGYIAYCVEQGIIDGMGDGTFQPEAQLTGYQWAKMLLCAVGFGANDEYVGASWSLNTAKDALDHGIFDGDLVGADHTPLQRQQAVLYAFNALTGVNVVVYSPSLGDYITRYGTFADRDTIEGTLGYNVYGLDSVTGIIIDNEGMGNANTVVSVTGSYTKAPANAADDEKDVSVSANTDLDMMYHAAKIWYAGSGKGAVYVMDLATVESLTCNDITTAAVNKLERNKTVVEKYIGDGLRYEYNLINNTAINADYAAVDFYYSIGTMGVRSTVQDTTAVVGNEGFANDVADNDDILTDIDDINRGDAIIYIVTKSTTGSGEAFHIYPVTYTTAKIANWSRINGTITLADDTVISKSVFADDTWYEDLERGATATIALDTHGHFINFNTTAARTVAYYTGTARNSSAHEAWYSDAAFVAQFADIATGEEFEVPVTADWLFNADAALRLNTANGYYDITDTVVGSSNYEPDPVNETNNVDYSAYAFKTTDSVTFTANTYRFSVPYGDSSRYVYFDNDNVTFVIASGVGSSFDTETVTGVDGLLEYYSDDFTANSVILNSLGMTGSYDAQGVFYADTIFAYTGATVTSGTLFFPTDLDTDDMDPLSDYHWYVEGGILNGTDTNYPITIDGDVRTHIERGFYSFSVNNAGVTTLTSLAHEFGPNMVIHSEGSSVYYISPDDGVTSYNASNAVVVDLRSGALNEEVDSISELADLYYANDNEYHTYRVNIAYVPSSFTDGASVSVIYVLDDGWEYNARFILSDELIAAGWRWEDADGKTYEELDGNYASTSLNGWTLSNIHTGFSMVEGGWYGDGSGYGIDVDVYQDGTGVSYGTTNGTMSYVDANTLAFPNGITLPTLTRDQRDVVVEISGLEISLNFASDFNDFTVTPSASTITLGEAVTVTVTGPASVTNEIGYTFSAPYTAYDITGTVQGSGYATDIVVYPACPGTYTLSAWASVTE